MMRPAHTNPSASLPQQAAASASHQQPPPTPTPTRLACATQATTTQQQWRGGGGSKAVFAPDATGACAGGCLAGACFAAASRTRGCRRRPARPPAAAMGALASAAPLVCPTLVAWGRCRLMPPVATGVITRHGTPGQGYHHPWQVWDRQKHSEHTTRHGRAPPAHHLAWGHAAYGTGVLDTGRRMGKGGGTRYSKEGATHCTVPQVVGCPAVNP